MMPGIMNIRPKQGCCFGPNNTCTAARSCEDTMADLKGIDSQEEEEPTIAEDVVVTKYKMAGDMANRVLKLVIDACKEGESARSICELGDKLILEETNKVYKKEKELKKGIGFPTCISVNNCVCHFSPLHSEPDVVLQNGDMVKIDLGVHIDGFIAAVAFTIVVGATKDNPVTGKKADVLQAAYLAAEVAQRLVKPGNENVTVTENIQKVGESFKCKPVEGMLTHQLERNRIDGDKTIIQNPNEPQKKEHKKCEFQVHEVYAIDILMSSGEGKAKEREARTTVYKKTDIQYSLKMKASRVFYSDVTNKFSTMPFTLRAFDDEKKAKMGVTECARHELLSPYPVLYEKDGEFVAQIKCTVLLMPNGPLRITGGPWDQEIVKSDLTIEDEDIKTILASSMNKKAQKKKKKKAAAKASEEGAKEPTESEDKSEEKVVE